MLNKEQILDKLMSLDFPKDQYCVMTGAALVLHGVKQETADIDIGCTSELFTELLKRGFEVIKDKPSKGILIDGCIEVFEDWMPAKTCLIQGIPSADLLEIKNFKEQLGRDKDLRDIMLIDRFLNEKQI